MRVHIESGGHIVWIDAPDVNVSYREVAAEALTLWRETRDESKGTEGPAFGLQSNERRGAQVSPMSLSYGHYMTEPIAKEAP